MALEENSPNPPVATDGFATAEQESRSPVAEDGRPRKEMNAMRSRCCYLSIVLAVLLVFTPTVANAGIGLSIDLVSFGPFSIGIDIPVSGPLLIGGLLILAGDAFISFFSQDSRIASYSGPRAEKTQVTIRPGDIRPAKVLRIQCPELVMDPKLPLPKGGYLELQDDGKFEFRGVDFDGYAYVHYDNTLTVWDRSGEPVLVVQAKGDKTLILQERSERASRVTAILFGL